LGCAGLGKDRCVVLIGDWKGRGVGKTISDGKTEIRIWTASTILRGLKESISCEIMSVRFQIRLEVEIPWGFLARVDITMYY